MGQTWDRHKQFTYIRFEFIPDCSYFKYVPIHNITLKFNELVLNKVLNRFRPQSDGDPDKSSANFLFILG